MDPAGRLRTICHVRPDQWLVEGISFYAGFALRWLRDSAAGGGRRPARLAMPGWRSWRRRYRPGRAGSPPGWPPPMPGPGRTGSRRCPGPGPPWPPGPASEARAIQEAAAYSTRRSAGLIRALLGPCAGQEVILTGGAARSTLWPQILADVLGCPVGVPGHTESAALGAAVLAGRAAGVLPADTQAGAQPDGAGWAVPAVSPGVVAQPGPSGQRAYDRLYRQWLPHATGDR